MVWGRYMFDEIHGFCLRLNPRLDFLKNIEIWYPLSIRIQWLARSGQKAWSGEGRFLLKSTYIYIYILSKVRSWTRCFEKPWNMTPPSHKIPRSSQIWSKGMVWGGSNFYEIYGFCLKWDPGPDCWKHMCSSLSFSVLLLPMCQYSFDR